MMQTVRRASPLRAALVALLVAVALFLPARVPVALDAQSACADFFADGRPPVVANPRLAPETVKLCFEAFAVLHSGISRTPLYAAERLTRAGVKAARTVERTDAFHEEERLPADARAVLADYVKSGYDRGHMAPAGDMPTPEALAESFSLANIVPQNRSGNRGLWASIEESVRRLALRRGALYVVTGPIFKGEAVDALEGRVLVPTQLFKAVYDPARGEAGAYLTENDADGAWRAVSLATLRDTAGLDVFPDLPEAIKAKAMSLPEPRELARDGSRSGQRDGSFEAWLKSEANRALHRLMRDLLRSIF